MSALPASLLAGIEMMPMQANDLDDVLAIEYAVFSFPWARGNFIDSMAAGYSCWVCRLAGELVGYFVLMRAVDEVHLLTIGVAARHQGQGLGARLLRQAMRVGHEGGATRLLLEVRPSNTRALVLYRHFGFRQIGVRRDYYPASHGREDALVLTCSLEETLA